MPRRPIGRFLRLPRSARRIRAEVDEELRFDIEMRAQDLAQQGLAPADALTIAKREFGDLETTREYCEELDMQREAAERRADVLEDLRVDLAIAGRAMRRTPAFATVVLLTLALGVGANTAVFSVVRRVLIERLAFRAPEQLYRLYTAPSQADGDDDKLSAVELAALATQSKSVEGVTQFGNYGSSTYTDDHTAEPWPTVMVSPNFFDVMGIRPALGRPFTGADVGAGAPTAVVISYAKWQSVFGRDPHVVGRPIELNGRRLTIVGVLPENFVGPTFIADALYPMNVAAILRNARGSRSRAYRAVARLHAGVSLAQFQAELPTLQARIQAQYPELKNAGVIRPKPLHAAIVGAAAPVLMLVMAGALLVLVVTCVNIAGLFLSRAVARRRELGVRAALGAGRGRLVRQVVAETALYGIVGGLLGVALAFLLKRSFLALASDMLPKVNNIPMSTGVLAAALGASLLCGIAFGVLPAIMATRLDTREALGDGGTRSSSQGRAGSRGSRALVMAQIAFAVVLVVGAGLLTRTFITLVRTELGYRADAQTLTFGLNPTRNRYPDVTALTGLVNALTTQLRALPGVTAVGYTAVTPWQGGMMSVPFRVDGHAVDEANVSAIELATASPEYFSALGVPIRMGRVFQSIDAGESPRVVVISESVARRFWPNASPIGARVRLDTGVPGDSAILREIVGVVGDIRERVTSAIEPTVYVPAAQYGGRLSSTFVVRGTGDAADLIPRVKQILHAIDPTLPLFYPRTLAEVVAQSVQRQRLAMGLMAAFATLALLLAALGIYGIMAYAVAARTREFGIRSALGAPRGAILSLVMRQGMVTALAGIAAGLVLAAVLSRFMSALVVGVSTHDVATFLLAPLVLGIVALIACLVPARAATRVQPVDALRIE